MRNTIYQINQLLNRVERRSGGISFSNPCPSGDEWQQLRRLVNTLGNDDIIASLQNRLANAELEIESLNDELEEVYDRYAI